MSSPFPKWRTWLDRIEHEQLIDLLLNRDMFSQMNECASPYIGTYQAADLNRWMTQNYVAFAATAIRRMMEKKHNRWQSISLRILLDDLAAHDSLLTRARYRRFYRGSIAEPFADRDFNRISRSANAAHVAASRINRDIRELERICKPVLQLVNKIIAHTEADRRKVGKASFGQIDRAITALNATFGRYHLLITGSEFASPPYESFDVRADLRKIWPPKP